jgi:hypothetical protein
LPILGITVLSFAPIGGCGDDSPGRDGAVSDAAMDGGPGDGGSDASVPDPPCRTPLVTGQPFAIDPAGPDTQIHVAASFDGESVWVVYNRPDPAGGFDVWAVRLDCDGSQRVAPFRVNTTDHNDIDPTLAIGGGRLYLAWQSDNGVFPDNLDLLVRSYLLDGTAVMATDRALDTVRNGLTETGSHWMPALAPLPGGFAVAGARAVEDASGFQLFVQRLTSDGADAEESFDASFAPLGSQTYPSMASTEDGALYLAYLQAVAPDWDDFALHTAVDPGARVADPLPAVGPAGRGLAGSVHVAAGTGGEVLLALGDATVNRIVLTDATHFGSGAPEVLLGEAGLLNYSPVVAVSPSGGAVAWYRHMAGLQNELWVQGFAFDGSAFSLGAPELATGEWVPPYQPTITHVKDDVFFVAWSQGTSPAFRLMGVFVELE